MWMDQVARGWLVYEMTSSPFLLGLTVALKFFPMLFLSLVAGVIADRYSRKIQIIIAEALNGVLHLALAFLIITNSLEVWHIMATALISGISQAFQHPARFVLIADLVDNRYLHNAIALNSVIFNVSRTLGPAFAGILIASIGLDKTYFAMAFIYLITVILTVQINEPPLRQRSAKKEHESNNFLGEMMEGLKYVRSDRIILALLALSLISSFVGQPYMSLMPIFAKDILNVGPKGLGLLLGFSGVGAIIGALFIGTLSRERALGTYLLAFIISFGILLVFFAFSPFFALSLALMILVGFFQTGNHVLTNTLVQTHTPNEIRGRVMGVYFLDRGIMPLGTLLAGTMAHVMGTPLTVSLMGVILALLATAITISMPTIRRLR